MGRIACHLLLHPCSWCCSMGYYGSPSQSGQVFRSWSTAPWGRIDMGFLLWLGDCCVGVHITAGVLSAVIRCSSVRYIHWDLYIIIEGAWCIGWVVRRFLLLLLLWMSLLILLMVSPGLWLELVSVLTEGIVKWLRVWESLSGPDEFNHLPAFSDVDSLCFVFSIGGWEWCSYDFI